jgi:hypothetical protein
MTEPGLFNYYTDIETASGDTVVLEEDGGIEVTTIGGFYGDDTLVYLTIEELERLAQMSRAVKEYYADE